jgi:hypothetical protein
MDFVPYQLDNIDVKMRTDLMPTPHQWLAYAKANFNRAAHEGVWVTTGKAIADHFTETHPV